MQETEIGRLSGLVAFRIVDPNRLAGRCVDRGYLTQRGADIEHASDHQRRSLITKRVKPRILREDFQIGRIPAPGNLQLLNVVLVYLTKRRILPASLIAAVEAPL